MQPTSQTDEFSRRLLLLRWLLPVLLAASLTSCNHRQPPADPAVGQRVADAFLAQLRAGQVDQAWQSTTAEFKSYEGRESFARYVRQHPYLKQPLTFVEYQVGELNGLPRGQCLYQPPSSAKSKDLKIRVAVAQEANEWKVEGVFVE